MGNQIKSGSADKLYDQVTALNNKLIPTSSEITLSNGQTAYVEKHNTLYLLKYNNATDSAVSSIIGQIPTGYKPSIAVQCIYGNNGKIYMNSQGEFEISMPAWSGFTFVYS